MTPRTPAEEEVANIECHIRMLLPEDYLARIGATVDAPNHKRELRHRCMRIFADLAERLTASPAAPEGETPRVWAEWWKVEGRHLDSLTRADLAETAFKAGALAEYLTSTAALATPPALPAPELVCRNPAQDMRDHGLLPSPKHAAMPSGPPAPVATMPPQWCADCDGQGRVLVFYDRPGGPLGNGYRACAACNGTGRRPDEGRR